MRRRVLIGGLAAAAALMAAGTATFWPRALPATPPLPRPDAPLATYHLGHSLVGRDMPAMLAQLAGHVHASQLGWGSSLRDHAKGTVAGFDTENAHPAHEPAEAALRSGRFDAVVLTEMVELRDAVRYHDSARWLAHWASLARAANPNARLYLYETWHRLPDPEGWLDRIDADLQALWTDRVLTPAMQRSGQPIYLIPAGQVMAAVTRAAEAGRIPGLTNRQDMFTDDIHLNDTGNYLVALTHFATLYHRDPTGLPPALTRVLTRADGTAATPIAPQTARALQHLVWATVPRYAATGMARGV